MIFFNYKKRQFRQWLVLGAFLSLSGFFIIIYLYNEHSQINKLEQERLLTQTRVVQENVASNLNSLNTSLTRLQNDRSILSFSESYIQRFKDLADAMPGVSTLFVMDSTGTIRVSNRPELIGRNLQERDYFKIPKQEVKPDVLYVSPPFKTVLGNYVINLSRCICNSEGEFLGIITAALDPDYFITLLSSVRYENDMWTYLSHGDGSLFLINPHREGVVGKVLSGKDSMLQRHLASNKSENVFAGHVKATDEERIIALSTIQPPLLKMNKPLVVAVSRDLAEVFSVWRKNSFVTATMFVVFGLLSIISLRLYQKRVLEAMQQKASAEENIKELSEELDRFFSLSLDLLCICDMDGHFRRLNRSWEETLGFSLDQLIGRQFFDFVHPDDIAATHAAMADLHSEKTVLNFVNRYRCKDGSYRWIEWRSIPYQNRLVYAVARDITELKQNQQALEKSERFMRMLTDILPGMVGYWTKELRCVFANISYLEWFGKTPEQMRSIHIRELMGEELFGKNEPFINAALRGERQRFERELIKADGSIGYTWAHYIPDIDGDQVKGFFVMVSDITELKQTQFQLEKLNKDLAQQTAEAEAANYSKSRFLANMSHEIRTPMNAILGLTRLVLNTDLTPSQKDYLRKVYNASGALMGILNDILDYSKVEAGYIEIDCVPMNIQEIVNDTAGLFRVLIEEKGLNVLIDIDPDVPAIVSGDPLRLHQVLNNLVGNAVKFTETGEIQIKVELKKVDGENLNLHFVVRDTGIGICKEQSERLFQAFTQADGTITKKYGGTGLGLAICRNLVKLMGGEIQVSSTEGEGATFTFSIQVKNLPSQPQSSVAQGKKTPGVKSNGSETFPANGPTASDLTGIRILLVEDNQINQDVAAEFLRQRGATVMLAGHGGEALDMVQKYTFDAVLMDIQMPVMDGLEATRSIHQLHKTVELPIIAMTSAVMQDDRERCKAAGMADFIAKPVNPDELVAVLRKCLKLEVTVRFSEELENTENYKKPAILDVASALHRLNGNTVLLNQLLLKFIEEHSMTPDELRLLLSAGKTDEALHLMHTVKGVASTLGAGKLAESAAVLEQELKRGVERSTVEFDLECKAVVSAITAFLNCNSETGRNELMSFPEPGLERTRDLLTELSVYLHEKELVPDELIRKLQILSNSPQANEINPLFKTLLRQLDQFDHGGALETVKRFNDACGFKLAL